jgi:DNA-binding NarL/FixJ family response regulator
VSPRVALVEDLRFVREPTVRLLQAHFGATAEVMGFTTVEELLEVGAARFDVVVLDLQIRAGGTEMFDAVRVVASATKVLVFSALLSGEALQRAEAAGASGYVCKDTAGDEELLAGVAAVLEGSHYVDPGFSAELRAKGKHLTPRQQEVLRLEALGCKMTQIGRALDPPLSLAGVRRNIERIVELHPTCEKQPDRVRLAISLGLVSPWEASRRYEDPFR